jgi:transposase
VSGVGVGELLRRLLGVKGLVVRGASWEPRGVVVEVRPRQRRPRCPECGRPGPGYDTRSKRLWRHLSLGRTVFWLSYAPRVHPHGAPDKFPRSLEPGCLLG